MADYRPIKVKIWRDAWFLSLNPSEKLLWIFLLTNDYVHISGVYEIPIELMTAPTGMRKDRIKRILDKFEDAKRIKYKLHVLFLPNYIKNQSHQVKKNPNITTSIQNHFKENPEYVDLMGLRQYADYKGLISPLHTPTLKIKEERVKSKDERSGSQNSPPKSSHKEIRELFDYFKVEYLKHISNKPIIFSWGRCEKAAKPFIKQIGLKRCKELVDSYLTSDDKFYKKTGYSLEVFLTANVLNAIDKNI